MAQNVGTAFVDIRADTTNFEKQLETSVNASLKTAQGTAQGFGKTTNESLMSISNNLTSVGKDLSKKVTLPLVAIGTGALLTAGNFEAGMNKVRAITGATESEIGQLSNQAKELGASTKFSATEAANAMSFLGMAGFDTSQILGAMPRTLELAAASNIGLAEAADIVSNVMSGFGIEVSDLGSTTDALAKALTSANTDLSGLGQAFKFVGPVAKGAGMSFNETAAAIGLLADTGIQAGMAGTSLRGAITALLNPSKQVSDIMMRLGLNVKDANGELLPLNEIIEQLEQSGASTGEMMQIFGQRAGPAMMALVEKGSEALRELTTELDNSGGTAKRIADIQMEGLNGQMTSLKSAVEGLMIAIGESGLLQAMTRFAGFLTNIARAMTNLNPAILTAVTALGAMAAAAGPLLIISGSLIRNFVTMRKALVDLRNSKIAATVAAHGLRTAMIGIPLLAVAAGALAIFAAFKKSGDEAKAMAEKVAGLRGELEAGASATEVARRKLEEMVRTSPAFGQALVDAGVNINEFAAMAEHDLEGFEATVDRVARAAADNITEFSNSGVIKNGKEIKRAVDEITNDLMAIPEATRQVEESSALLEKSASISMESTAAHIAAMAGFSIESLQEMADAATREALQTEEAMAIIGQASEIAAREVETELGKIEKAAEDLSREVERSMSAAASSFLRLSDEGKKNIDAFIRDTIEGAARLTVFQDNVTAIGAATSGEFANYLLAMGMDVEELVRDMADPRKADELQRAFSAWEIATQAAGRNMADEFAKVDPAFKKTLDGIAGLTDRELQEIRNIAEQRAVEIGTAMMQGQVQGIAANSPLVQNAIRRAVGDAITAAMAEAGIRSPSRRMAEQVGLPMAQGVAVGIEEGSDEIDAAMRRTVQEALLSAAKELEKRITDISQRTGDSFFKNLVPKPDDLAAVEEVRDKVTGEIKKMGREALIAGDVWIESMIQQTKKLRGFQDNVTRIAELTSGEFGLYLLEMGEDAEELVRDLADPQKVARLDQAYAAWLDSTAAAGRDMVSEFAKVDPGFAEVLANLSITIEEEVKPAIDKAKRGGSAAGSGLVSSAIAGIQSELPALRRQIAEYEAILARRNTLASAPPMTQGGPGGFGVEGEAGLYGGPLVSIGSATFTSGTDAQAVAQQIRASLGAMIPV